MKVKVTKPFSAVPTENDVYPKPYMIGDVVEGYPAQVALRNNWGETIDEPEQSGADDGASAPSSAPALRARLASPYHGPDQDGSIVKFAEGAIVEGATAEFLIAQGVALEVQDAKKPQETKARGAAPKNK